MTVKDHYQWGKIHKMQAFRPESSQDTTVCIFKKFSTGSLLRFTTKNPLIIMHVFNMVNKNITMHYERAGGYMHSNMAACISTQIY